MEQITIYADDNLLTWKISGCSSLDQACRELVVVIQVLEELGMEVSSGKSEAVLSLKGSKLLPMLRRHTCKKAGVCCLVASYQGGRILIPIKQELKYLGVKLPYAAFEFQSMCYRSPQARSSFNSLRKALQVNGPLSTRERLRVYRACLGCDYLWCSWSWCGSQKFASFGKYGCSTTAQGHAGVRQRYF